jgi:hypothetical protein
MERRNRCSMCGTPCYNKLCHVCIKKDKYRVGMMKGTSLRKCLNPECDYYYYGDKRDRYCSPECYHVMNRKRNNKNVKRWRKNNPEKNKIINQRYQRNRKLKNESRMPSLP